MFHENRLLADDSHEISYLIFDENQERCCKICRLLQPRVNVPAVDQNKFDKHCRKIEDKFSTRIKCSEIW